MYPPQRRRINALGFRSSNHVNTPFREKVRELVEELKEQDTLELPEPRRPEEMGGNDDPKYYPYHQLISNSIGDFFFL